MKTQSTFHNRKSLKYRLLPVIFLYVFSLAACMQSPSTDQQVVRQQGGGQPPVILKVEARQEIANGYLFFYKDIYFMDLDTDAVAMVYTVTSSTLPYELQFPDTPVGASADAQEVGALFTEIAACWQKMQVVYEGRIMDRAGNLSEPVPVSLDCQSPVPLNTGPFLLSGLVTAVIISLVLLLGFGLLFRKQPEERLPAILSTILLTFLFMFGRFIHLIIHEGGHSLYSLVHNIPTSLYIHPFFFRGFSRPIIIGSSFWKDILGSAVALPIALLIFNLFWKRRSPTLLPLVILFPFVMLTDGINIMGIQDDFRNLVESTGLPAALFFILGTVFFCIGLITMLSLFPLAGLDPRDNKALFVLPAAMFLGCLLSFPVAYLVVPGSPINLDYFMGREILADNYFLTWVPFGLFFGVAYITLYRWLSQHLPGWLRAETARLSWKDLLLPGSLWVVSVVIGLVIII